MRFFILFLLFTVVQVSAETVPEWFIPLRDAIYEHKLTADEIYPLYQSTSNRARTSLTGAAQLIMLSRCEYMVGRAYQYEDRKNEAIKHYDEGIRLAERALELQESAEAWVILAENISQSCVVRPTSYAIANGLKVERFSKNALALNDKNAAAKFMIAARWVFAPSPFHNYNRGIEMLNAIPNDSIMDKDDMFNIYSSLGYAYIQRRNKTQASYWLLKSLEIYPTNKFAQSLLAGL
jgi:tetratricopeptide (TPR) repeat protein